MPVTPYIGNYGDIRFAKESVFGTGVAATGSVRIDSESLASDPGVKSVPSIRGTRAENNTFYLGEYMPDGQVATWLFPTEGIQLLAAAICGAGGDTVTGTGPYVHTMAPGEAGLISLTLEKNLAGLKSLQYVGSLVDKLALNFAVDAPVKAAYDFIMQNDTQIVNTSPSYTTETPYALSNIAVSIFGSANANVTAVDIEINNNVKRQFAFSGNRYAVLNYSGARVITGKVTVILQSMTDYGNAVAGTPGALVVTCTQGASVAAFTLNNIIWGKPLQPLKRGELITQELPFTAYYLGGTADLSVAITNTVSGAYA